VVAPATAHVLARLALGFADDLVTTVALATRAPLVLAPAMNAAMWDHPATRGHLSVLKERGATVIEPAEGLLACGEEGHGKLASIEEIAETIEAVLSAKDLSGRSFLVLSGPTISRIDAVRYLTNRSTGLMGAALAEVAVRRGASVHFLTGTDKGVVSPMVAPYERHRLETVRVETAEEMLCAARERLAKVEGVLCPAAVLDYRVAKPATGKLKRSSEEVTLTLEPSPDVLRTLKQEAQRGQWFLGFAAETDDVLDRGRQKLASKGVDFLFANRIGSHAEQQGFGIGEDRNAGWLLIADGGEFELPPMSKRKLAWEIWDRIVASLARATRPTP
jgi:phosphopantothenoylcysteine decarboxylase/phosphopantothenate--cysteine ligase